MGRFVFGAAALVLVAASPAAAERPWRQDGHAGDRRCGAVLHWASLEPSGTAAERAMLRSAMLVACSPAGAAPPPPVPRASPPPVRFIQVRWSARKAASVRAKTRAAKAGKGSAEIAAASSAFTGFDVR